MVGGAKGVWTGGLRGGEYNRVAPDGGANGRRWLIMGDLDGGCWWTRCLSLRARLACGPGVVGHFQELHLFPL